MLHRSPLDPTLTIALVAMATAALGGCSAPSSGEARRGTQGKIVNGTESTEEHDATIFIANAVGACTGTMIAPNLVLTAAHCVVARQN
jgi:V8-like Glu-specific endopeptidase